MADLFERPDNVAVVLCGPRLSENVGTAARAVANMGLGRLILVRPCRLEWDLIRNSATRAAEFIVDKVAQYDDLPSALAEFHFVIGTTARPGSNRGPAINPRDMAARIKEMGPDKKVAVVFGPERTGLTTADLRLCQAVVRIPTVDRKTGSLNLAQAVLIVGYELLLAVRPPAPPPDVLLAPAAEVLAMYDHLARTMVDIGFLPDQNTGHWLMSFKRLFNRSGLTHGECNLIRGMCRQIEWALANRSRDTSAPDKKKP